MSTPTVTDRRAAIVAELASVPGQWHAGPLLYAWMVRQGWTPSNRRHDLAALVGAGTIVRRTEGEPGRATTWYRAVAS